jgi:hypothetical protein
VQQICFEDVTDNGGELGPGVQERFDANLPETVGNV